MKRLLAIGAIVAAAVAGGVTVGTAGAWDGYCGSHENPVPCEEVQPTPAPVPPTTEQTPVVAPQPVPVPVPVPTPTPTTPVAGPHPLTPAASSLVVRSCSWIRGHYAPTYGRKIARRWGLVCYPKRKPISPFGNNPHPPVTG